MLVSDFSAGVWQTTATEYMNRERMGVTGCGGTQSNTKQEQGSQCPVLMAHRLAGHQDPSSPVSNRHPALETRSSDQSLTTHKGRRMGNTNHCQLQKAIKRSIQKGISKTCTWLPRQEESRRQSRTETCPSCHGYCSST